MGEPSAIELLTIGLIAIISCFGGMVLLMKTTEWSNKFAGNDK